MVAVHVGDEDLGYASSLEQTHFPVIVPFLSLLQLIDVIGRD